MRVFRFAAAVIVLAASATVLPERVFAQMGGGGDSPHINILADGPSKTPDELEAEQQRDQAYKESLKKIPNAKASADPWGGVRTTDAPKAVAPAKTAASAKPKTKTGSN